MILNYTTEDYRWEVYPFIHDFCNIEKEDHAFTKILVPDVVPSAQKKVGKMSMAAGEFLEVYSKPDQQKIWDCVVTSFFIDTAHNIIDYIQCINRNLKIGGLWTNLGPLLYHYSEMPDKIQIELSWEEVEKIIPQLGFMITRKEFRMC